MAQDRIDRGGGSAEPSLEDFEAMAAETFEGLPEMFRTLCADLVIRVEDLPTEEICVAMELESPFDLLGLYEGEDLINRALGESGAVPDMVFLYRLPILSYRTQTPEPLRDIIAHVLIHEIGHHFGFSDDDMEAIEEDRR